MYFLEKINKFNSDIMNSKRSKSSSQRNIEKIKKTKIFLPLHSNSLYKNERENKNYFLNKNTIDSTVHHSQKVNNSLKTFKTFSNKNFLNPKKLQNVPSIVNDKYNSHEEYSNNNVSYKSHTLTTTKNFYRNPIMSPRNQEVMKMKKENKILKDTLLKLKNEYKILNDSYIKLKQEILLDKTDLNKEKDNYKAILVNKVSNNNNNELLTINTLSVSDLCE